MAGTKQHVPWQKSCKAAGLAKAITVENVAGAGGTVGLAQFAEKNKGDGSALLVNGLVMVGAVLTNKSPVSLVDTTPIARLTGEYEVIVVPAASPLKTLADLAAAMKADIGRWPSAAVLLAVQTTFLLDLWHKPQVLMQPN